MRVIIEPDYEKMSKWAAQYVAKRINDAKPTVEKPFKLGCPTGSSPLGLYRELIKMNKEGKVSFQHVVTFNMDEYVNLPEEHPESYHSFMWNNFFSHIDIKKENVHILNGNAPDLKAECEVSVGTDTTHEKVDATCFLNHLLVVVALCDEVGSVTVEDVNILGFDVDVAEEVVPHEAVV